MFANTVYASFIEAQFLGPDGVPMSERERTLKEYRDHIAKEPNMPRSRFKLAIPFVGKDAPSPSSEFAQAVLLAYTQRFDFRELPPKLLYNEHFAIIILDAEGEEYPLPYYLAAIENAGYKPREGIERVAANFADPVGC